MRFRRKSADATPEPAVEGEEPVATEAVGLSGPFDAADVADDGVDRVDLGSLLITPEPDRELRLQVDEASQVVQSVLLAGPDGALELRAFAAPRHGELWPEHRQHIAAETARHGGTATEREGRFGTELVCQRPLRRPDGKVGLQPSRVVGVDGPRWFLRATFLGRPAVDPDDAADWEETLAHVVVNRGSHAMPPGDALPITLPPEVRRPS